MYDTLGQPHGRQPLAYVLLLLLEPLAKPVRFPLEAFLNVQSASLNRSENQFTVILTLCYRNSFSRDRLAHSADNIPPERENCTDKVQNSPQVCTSQYDLALAPAKQGISPFVMQYQIRLITIRSCNSKSPSQAGCISQMCKGSLATGQKPTLSLED